MFKIIALIRMFVNCDSQVISPAKPDFHIRCNQFVSPSHVLLPCGYLLDYGLTSLLLSTIFCVTRLKWNLTIAWILHPIEILFVNSNFDDSKKFTLNEKIEKGFRTISIVLVLIHNLH